MNALNLREVTKRGRKFHVTPTENTEEFWNQVEIGGWEENTFSVLDNFINPNTLYMDIGCWVGPTVLYAAQTAKHTFAFEPDPIAYEAMVNNLRANNQASWYPKVHLEQKAVAANSGVLQIGSRGTGGDSTSSALFANKQTKWTVESIKLDEFLRSKNVLSENTFIKLDIEGGEFELVPSIQPYLCQPHVSIYISFHTNFLSMSLKRNGGVLEKIRRRIFVTYKHWVLVKSLPFKFFYDADGAPIHPFFEVIKLLITGRFPLELVGSHKSWAQASAQITRVGR